jgi:hypothetical protein
VLREFVGEAVADRFGWIGRNVGDSDGDDVADLAHEGDRRPAVRQIYVYSRKSGTLLFAADVEPGDRLGWGGEGAGMRTAKVIPRVRLGLAVCER